MKNFMPAAKICLAVLLVFLLFFANGRVSHGYVMPTEQLLDLMSANFSPFRSLSIVQSTLQRTGEGERVFMEQINMRSPDRFSIRPLDRLGERKHTPDMSYRQLLMANSTWDLEQLLINMGINIEKTALTRYNGTIAYRIGDDCPACPKLIIQRHRFLPVLLEYKDPDGPECTLTRVQFRDYRDDDRGRYPYEIIFSVDDTITENHSIQTFQANTQVDASILERFRINSDLIMPVKKEKPADTGEAYSEDSLRVFEEQ